MSKPVVLDIGYTFSVLTWVNEVEKIYCIFWLLLSVIDMLQVSQFYSLFFFFYVCEAKRLLSNAHKLNLFFFNFVLLCQVEIQQPEWSQSCISVTRCPSVSPMPGKTHKSSCYTLEYSLVVHLGVQKQKEGILLFSLVLILLSEQWLSDNSIIMSPSAPNSFFF